MGEIKSVKVDNWGVFFLQKLQNFFNKTDYCDLTLQFRDNSQLKVHRLVLSACTDYFNALEQTCEVVDDAIIMPNGLQADVVVPIVNFMYTGTLEFELKMYNRLLRTAKDMNMTVLLKLLEAHRRTMEMHPPKATGQSSPKPRRRAQGALVSGNLSSSTGARSLIQTNQGNKRIVVGSNINRQPNRGVATSNVAARPMPVRQIGSTTFTRIKVESDQQESNTHLSTSGGYSLIKQSHHQQPQQQPTSPFEQLRKGYNNNKRPAVSSFVSPPAKKPNLEDVKEFAEQQRMRKQIAAEYGDDDYDASNIMDDDTIHNDDDDDEMTSSGQVHSSPATGTSISAGVQTVASSSSQQTQSEDPPGTTTIIVKHEGPDKPPTIVVKDSSNSKMNHAKIISEVLRQYPHLVRSNKNIKLKIMPNAGGQAQKIIVKKEPMEAEKQMQQSAHKASSEAKMSDNQHHSAKTLASNNAANRQKTMQQQHEATQSGKPSLSGAQSSVSKTNVSSSSAGTQSAGGVPQKRRIDSKTMHALIALGAENVTGPWLCLRCGRNGHPISIPSYRGFRRHLINTHKETIDPALCEHCGWRSASKRELHFHMQLEHKIKTSLYIFPECQLCQQMCIDSDGLNQHLIDSHPDENKQQCIYCNKIFPEELQLYTHMKTFHKKQALEDGIIDYSDDENQAQMSLPPLPPLEYEQDIEQEQKVDQQQKKVKILSDISLPIASSIIKTDSFAQHTSASAEEYLQEQEHNEDISETKFVAADGSEVILTAEQRKEILSQLNQEHEGAGGVVMVLNEGQQPQQFGSSEIQSDHGAISQDETSQATTANEERVEEEEHGAEDDDLRDENQIYSEIKSLHSNLDDSTTQSEAEGKQETSFNDEEHEEAERDADHEERTEHLDESKESMDNLEWAENLISEHDLADDASAQTAKGEKEEIKDDDKSQDEISKKLKELTGDWSEDDDDDEEDLTEEPAPETSLIKESSLKPETSATEQAEVEDAVKKEIEAEKLAKDQEENTEFDDHAALLATLQSTDKDDIFESTEKLPANNDCENIDEDDIDLALRSLHKGDVPDEKITFKPDEQQKFAETENTEEAAKGRSPKANTSEATKKKVDEEEEEIKAKEAATGVGADDEEKPEEKLVKELENINEPDVASSAMEVDEETKKDLLESLLSEQAETMENTATEQSAETPTIKLEKDKVKPDRTPSVDKDKEENDENAMDETNLDDSKTSLSNTEEFLDNSPEKTAASDDAADAPTSVAATSSNSEAAAAVEAEPTDKTEGSSTKQENTMSSEDQVKSLISEWGDDDEDEDENDADLSANL